MKNTNRLKLLLNLYKFFKPKLYKKMILTGRLFEFLTKEYDEELKIEKKPEVKHEVIATPKQHKPIQRDKITEQKKSFKYNLNDDKHIDDKEFEKF